MFCVHGERFVKVGHVRLGWRRSPAHEHGVDEDSGVWQEPGGPTKVCEGPMWPLVAMQTSAVVSCSWVQKCNGI